MPTYQYVCTNCGEQLEAVQKFTDDPLTVCPACEGRLRKLFNSVGIVFKGSGFYRTDSRNGSGDKSLKASDTVKASNGSASSSGPASSGESSKSESKSNGSSSASTSNSGSTSSGSSSSGSSSSKSGSSPAKAASA